MPSLTYTVSGYFSFMLYRTLRRLARSSMQLSKKVLLLVMAICGHSTTALDLDSMYCTEKVVTGNMLLDKLS